eukprot:6227702-Alexandrium_andersonii.AAC.1
MTRLAASTSPPNSCPRAVRTGMNWPGRKTLKRTAMPLCLMHGPAPRVVQGMALCELAVRAQIEEGS